VGPTNLQLMPARWLPLLYFAFAHACLAAAFATAALEPRRLAGFFYHPRLVAVVHLVTLGWVSASILGSLYVVGPLALRLPLAARRMDYVAFVAFAVGVLGMVSHFWIDRLSGMAWAGGLVALAILAVALRVVRALPRAAVPREIKLHVGLALLNAVLAAVVGILLGIHKVAPFLPLPQLGGVLGHAHLAAVGFGVMMVMGAGYRMLPMMLPAAMPRGAWVYGSAILTEAGALGLLAAFPFDPRLVPLFAVTAALGILAFLGRVGWMFRNPRPAPRELLRPDWGVAHSLASFVWLGVALGLGLALAFAAPSEWTLQTAMAYGVFGLVGFLAQIVVGVESRLLPLFAWLRGFADAGFEQTPPSLHAAPVRGLQALGFLLWASGVPLLAAGLGLDRLALLVVGAAALLIAVIVGALNGVLVLHRLGRVRG